MEDSPSSPIPERNSIGDYSESEPLCCHEHEGRNLIVCIDGTANQFGRKNTNVIELYSLILKGHDQRTWYNSGIGTYAQPSWKSLKYYKKVLIHKIDLAIAWNFERTVLGAYQWLSDNYEEKDCIFLFGFSRGAYQVRVLSAMINKVGLIHKGNEMQIPFAFELYADPESGGSNHQIESSTRKNETDMAARFKRAFSQDVKVHFVGAWDTVSSIGVMRGKKMLPGTTNGMKHVCYFRHALALDERRVKYLPEYTFEGAIESEQHATTQDETTDRKTQDAKKVGQQNRSLQIENQGVLDGAGLQGKPPQTLEVWFAGTHSDIGGGNTENAGMDRRKPPLRWMALEARKFGLRTAQLDAEFITDDKIEIIESLTGIWWILEFLPLKRLTLTRRVDGKCRFTYKPHLGSPRKIHPGQKIHHSVLLSDSGEAYIPKARPPDNEAHFWKKLGLQGEWLAHDLYTYIQIIVERLVDGDRDNTLRTLNRMAKRVDGRQAVYDKMVEALNREDLDLRTKHEILTSLTDILGQTPEDNTQLKRRNLKFASEFLENKEYREATWAFMAQYTDSCIHEFCGHDAPSCAALSPNGMDVVWGSVDNTVRVWNARTGETLRVFRGHSGRVTSVAFSSDGQRVVSGSRDKTIRIWNVKTGESLKGPFRGHSSRITSVAFSHDGEQMVSGSNDWTVRIWNVKTGEPSREPFRGHSDSIKSVAFSPDGGRVVSGSNDRTVRIWNTKTGETMREFEHSDSVNCVAFSGECMASGSDDGTIWVWNANTGETLRVFRGHSSRVTALIFSHDGERLISGSFDKTIRIWDAKIGELMREPFRGHSDSIWSVAFSPNEEHVVSSSGNGSVRIWLV